MWHVFDQSTELHSKENMESHKYWSYNKDIDLVNWTIDQIHVNIHSWKLLSALSDR